MPWDQINSTPIAAGFAAYQSANPSDSLVYLINLGYSLSGSAAGDLYNLASVLHHMNVRGDAAFGSLCAQAVTAAISSSGGGYSSF